MISELIAQWKNAADRQKPGAALQLLSETERLLMKPKKQLAAAERTLWFDWLAQAVPNT